jgi:hypothetical protein
MNKYNPDTLYLVSSFGEISLLLNAINNNPSPNIVVFDNKDLFSFLMELDLDSKKIYFVKKAKHSIKNPFSYVHARYYYKKKIKYFSEKFKDIKIAHCFHIYGNIFCYKLAKEILVSDSKLFSYECLKFTKKQSMYDYPINFLRTIMLIFIYGRNVKVFPTKHKFFEMFNIKNIKCQKSTILFNECQEIRQNFSMTSFFSYSHPFTHIFFDQPVVNYGRVSESEYINFFEEIKKHYHQEIKLGKFCVKLHPGNHSDLKFYDGIELIPSFIPSECLETDNKSNWLAISSQTLWANNKAKKIALINLINYVNNDTRLYIRESLLTKYKTIAIPKDFNALKSLEDNIT